MSIHPDPTSPDHPGRPTPGSHHRRRVRYAPLALAAAILLVSAAVLATRGDTPAATLSVQIAMVLPAPLALERAARVRIPTSLHAMYALLLLAGPWLGSALGLYDAWEPWDTLVHFYSGIPIALGSVLLVGVTAARHGFVLPPWFEALTVVGLHSLVAILWEVAEFTADVTLGSHTQRGNTDTMEDLIVGTLGSLLVALALLAHRTRGRPRWMGHLAGADPRLSSPS